MTTERRPEPIRVTLSDRWHALTRHGLRVGSPDVGMSRVELVGDAAAWAAARADVASRRERARGPAKASATSALARIDFELACRAKRPAP